MSHLRLINKVLTVGVFVNSILLGCTGSTNKITYRKLSSDKILKTTTEKKLGGQYTTEQELSLDSLEDGLCKIYGDTDLLVLGHYSKGKKVGTWTTFTRNKDTSEIENWLSNHQIGPQIIYKARQNRKSLFPYRYEYYDIFGRKVFTSYFNEQDTLISSSGAPNFMGYNKDSIRVNDRFYGFYYFGVPQGVLYKLSVCEIDNKSGRKIFEKAYHQPDDTVLFDSDYGQKLNFDKLYSDSGSRQWIFNLQEYYRPDSIFVNHFDTVNVFVN
jgi:hypothetical protein